MSGQTKLIFLKIWPYLKEHVSLTPSGLIVYKNPEIIGSNIILLIDWMINKETKTRPFDAKKFIQTLISDPNTVSVVPDDKRAFGSNLLK